MVVASPGLCRTADKRSIRMAAAHRAIGRLHASQSMGQLVNEAVRQVGDIGFDRCLISRITDSRWLPQAAWSATGAAGADAMIMVGTRARKLLDSKLIETEVIRSRQSMLVCDVQSNARVHAELKRLNQTTAYVVAPVIAGSEVVGFIHADNFPEAAPVDEVDREALAMYTACFGFAVERVHYQERFDEIRRQLDIAGSSHPNLSHDTSYDRRTLSGMRHDSDNDAVKVSPISLGAATERLTRREVEVLTHLAAGETNRVIAARLFVSETTIKAHVKHILCKLGAANRAEAVSRYLRGA